MDTKSLIARACPVCGSETAAKQTTALKLPPISVFTGRDEVFPRKNLWSCCPDCQLEFVPHAPPESFYLEAYRAAVETNWELDEQAAQTAADLWFNANPSTNSVVEWGSGRGSFLSKLQEQKIRVLGFEPNKKLREASKVPTWDPDQIDQLTEKFSGLSIQLSLEHFYEPKLLISKIRKHLKPGATVMLLYHDAGAIPHKLLGSSSPLYDLQHLQIFRKTDIQRLLSGLGMEVISDFSYSNCYSLSYWLRLLGLPPALQKGNFKIKIPAGNRCCLAKLN